MSIRPVSRSTPPSAPAPSSGREVSYRSTQMLLALWVILPLTAVPVIVLTWGVPAPPWLPALIIATLVLPLLLLGRLVIELRGGLLRWRYGFIGWPRWQIAISEIVDIKAARGPSAHAGIQFSGKRRVFTASLGSPALELTLGDGRSVLLGSPEPDRLARFVRARLPDRR